MLCVPVEFPDCSFRRIQVSVPKSNRPLVLPSPDGPEDRPASSLNFPSAAAQTSYTRRWIDVQFASTVANVRRPRTFRQSHQRSNLSSVPDFQSKSVPGKTNFRFKSFRGGPPPGVFERRHGMMAPVSCVGNSRCRLPLPRAKKPSRHCTGSASSPNLPLLDERCWRRATTRPSTSMTSSIG